MTTLVIVESPAKCSKIQEYLGPGYRVTSSMGHIRALKPDLDSVGIERDWVPTYEFLSTKSKTISQLRSAAADADEVVLATDDDREGEGIAFHICAALKLNPLTTKRIIFHAITKQEIQQAIQNPRIIDMNKFHSQQARAMLDMLIGYTISPVLWKQLNSNGLPLSAGRCQTPALKLVFDRDREIETHAAKRFWSFTAAFTVGILKATEASRSNLTTDEETRAYLAAATADKKSTLQQIKESVRTHGAPKPLITSSLQQEASKLYNIQPKATMSAAQRLYEAGHITYMRTDNAFLSKEGAEACRAHIRTQFAPEYEGPAGQHQGVAEPVKKAKKKTEAQAQVPQAQAAHEAIRPTHPELETVPMDALEQKVYRLIWTRALQSQMAAALDDCRSLTFTIDGDATKTPWNGEQIKVKFQGWKALTATDKKDETDKLALDLWQAWSKVIAGTAASWLSVTAEEGFTKAAARYTEASLIHELEQKGIGRPSTFANLVSTIIDRNYVEKSDSPGTQIDVKTWLIQKPNQLVERIKKQLVGKESNKLQTTPLGRTVAEFIYKYYADIFEYAYTANMELELDHVAKGERPWKTLLQSSWDQYKARYESHTKVVLDPEQKKQQGQAKKRDLGDGIAVILSRKGPLLLRGEKDFASLPQGTSYETITVQQALRAYELKEGLPIGEYNDKPIVKKKGPYGFYAQCDQLRVPVKPDDTLEIIVAKFEQKETASKAAPAFERKVGEFTLKSGPYGLYFYKPALKKAQFVSLPATADKDKVTAEDLTTFYAAGLKAKKWKKKD
jgi:DNA topoisomerase I